MTRTLIVLLTLSSVSAFAQIPGHFRDKEIPSVDRLYNWGVFIDKAYDNGVTTIFDGPLLSESVGISRFQAKHFCEDYNYLGTIQHSAVFVIKNLKIMQNGKDVKGPNAVLESIECIDP